MVNKNKKLMLWTKWLITVVILSSFILLVQQQQPKQYEDVLAKQASNISTMPVQMTTVTGQHESKENDHIGSQSSEKKDRADTGDVKEAQTDEQSGDDIDNKEKNDLKEEHKKTLELDDALNTKQAPDGQQKTAQQRTKEGTGKSTNKKEQIAGELSGEQEVEQAKAKEIIRGDKDENPYFTTSIQNNETVSKSIYKFSITHKNNKLKPTQTIVAVNDLMTDEFTGEVELKQGKNIIKIQVKYEDEKELVERQYTVYYAENKLIIRTNLRDGMTASNKTIQFTAISYFNDTEFGVNVQLDNEKLLQNDDGMYEAALKEGKNVFKIHAEKDGERVTEVIHILYEKKVNRIQFSTDLQNKQVSSAEFSFYATAALNGKDIPLTAKLNGESIAGKNDFYFDLLKEGKNTVEIAANAENDIEKESYVIYYNEPQETTNETVPDDQNGPVIKTDLKSGVQIRGSIKNINVWATNSENKRLQAGHVAVTVNGKGIGFIWDDKEKTSYKLKLREGENKVIIKAWDEEGRITTKSFKVYAKNIDEGNIIGHATISLEAGTLGLGNLIAPTKVELHEGEKASYVIDQYLREHQYTYNNTGTLDANFYLAAISKANITKNLKIPADLAKILKKEAEYYEPTDYAANSISEFTISNGSGWMYSINGDYPNYGFSDAYLLDGDVVRIRFTLFYGADINGFGATGNGSNDNEETSKNVWDKEW